MADKGAIELWLEEFEKANAAARAFFESDMGRMVVGDPEAMALVQLKHEQDAAEFRRRLEAGELQ